MRVIISEHGRLMDPRLTNLLKYGALYASSSAALPSVGTPSDFIDEAYISASGWTSDPTADVVAAIRRDPAGIPPDENREGYCPGKHLAFWLSGYQDYKGTLALINAHGLRYGRCLDFGGSTGRVFRHFAYNVDNWEVWSCDFKLGSVEWNLANFDNRVRVFANTSIPVLPLEDNSFDLVTAYSVFTHLNEPELNWLLELRRILRPGGIAYLTIHDEVTWKNLSPSLRSTIEKWRPDVLDAPEMPPGKTVITFRNDDPYNCNVFHGADYIKNVWGRFFDICEVRSTWVGQQAAVVCRKPAR